MNVPEFEKELTYQFKTDMRNLMNFDLNTQKHNLYKVTNLPFQNHPPPITKNSHFLKSPIPHLTGKSVILSFPN